MSENDDKDFEFIKEQVIIKKRKKIKKYLMSFVKLFTTAVLFGIIAALTFAFCLKYTSLNNILQKEEGESRLPVRFPSVNDETEPTDDEDEPNNEPVIPGDNDGNFTGPEPVIVEQTILANIDDFNSMHTEIRRLALNTNKSIVRISSIINTVDWFNNPVEKRVTTTGLVVWNNNLDLLILVSLDRVMNANSIKLEITDMVSIDAVIQDYETDLNLAVLAVRLEDIPTLFLDNISVARLGESFTILVGNPVLALGNPNGHPMSMELGFITSRGSTINIVDNRLDLFNTSIVDNPNSDGVIVNFRGEVIGLITRTLKEGVNKDVNTVIGISKLKPIIERMVNQTPRVYFGVIASDMSESVKQGHNILNGIYVNEVQARSPAFSAELKSGDIIMKVNDQDIRNTNDFNRIISGYQAGELINVLVKRTSGVTTKDMLLRVRLAEKVR